MAKLTLSDLSSLTNESTALSTINNNNTTIETALEKTLSRDGTSPNSMEADFDMDSNRILNLPVPASSTEPLRRGDIGTLVGAPGTEASASDDNPVIAGTASPGISGNWSRSDHVHPNGYGTNVGTFLSTPSSANLAAAVTDETGSGSLVFATAPTLSNPVVGTQSARDGSTKAASTAYVDGATRTKLTADTTFYVRTAGATNPGSNSNNGLANTAGGAWLTINYAILWLYKNIDAAGYKIVLQVADDTTITEAISLYPIHGINPGGWSTNELVLRGNTTTPANVRITATGNNCIQAVNVFTGWRVEGFEFRTVTSGQCVLADFGSVLYLGKNNYGSCAGIHIQSLYNSKIEIVDDYTASGSAALHWYAESGGQILVVGGKTLTFSGSPAWSSAFAYFAKAATVTATGMLFSSTATGPRFLGDHTGSFATGGVALDTFLASAGDSAGSVTACPVAFGGTGTSSIAGIQTALNQSALGFKITGVNFNSANSDNAISVSLPSGFTRYRVSNVMISHASGALTTATCSVWTGTGGTGTNIVAAATAITVSTASENTNNNTQNLTIVNSGTISFTASTLYFRVQTPQGSAATADVMLVVIPVS